MMVRALAALVVALLPMPAAGENPVPLDRSRIAHLTDLSRLAGRPLTVDQLRGRPVIVSFFASWCPPCNTEFEHLNLLHLSHAADGLTVVAVNLFEDFTGFEDDGARLDRFLDRHQPVFSVVRGSSETARLFGAVSRIPTVFVFDRRGRARLHFVHAPGSDRTNPGYEDLRDAVRNAIGFGAADRHPALPPPADSVTNPSHITRVTAVPR